MVLATALKNNSNIKIFFFDASPRFLNVKVFKDQLHLILINQEVFFGFEAFKCLVNNGTNETK